MRYDDCERLCYSRLLGGIIPIRCRIFERKSIRANVSSALFLRGGFWYVRRMMEKWLAMSAS